jgi:hypothetical protein
MPVLTPESDISSSPSVLFFMLEVIVFCSDFFTSLSFTTFGGSCSECLLVDGMLDEFLLSPNVLELLGV